MRTEAGVGPTPDSLPLALLGWVLGCVFVYSGLFGAGSFIYGRMMQGTIFLALFLLSTIGLVRLLPRLWSGAADS